MLINSKKYEFEDLFEMINLSENTYNLLNKTNNSINSIDLENNLNEYDFCLICLEKNNNKSFKLYCGCNDKYHIKCVLDEMKNYKLTNCPFCDKNIYKNTYANTYANTYKNTYKNKINANIFYKYFYIFLLSLKTILFIIIQIIKYIFIYPFIILLKYLKMIL